MNILKKLKNSIFENSLFSENVEMKNNGIIINPVDLQYITPEDLSQNEIKQLIKLKMNFIKRENSGEIFCEEKIIKKKSGEFCDVKTKKNSHEISEKKNFRENFEKNPKKNFDEKNFEIDFENNPENNLNVDFEKNPKKVSWDIIPRKTTDENIKKDYDDNSLKLRKAKSGEKFLIKKNVFEKNHVIFLHQKKKIITKNYFL